MFLTRAGTAKLALASPTPPTPSVSPKVVFDGLRADQGTLTHKGSADLHSRPPPGNRRSPGTHGERFCFSRCFLEPPSLEHPTPPTLKPRETHGNPGNSGESGSRLAERAPQPEGAHFVRQSRTTSGERRCADTPREKCKQHNGETNRRTTLNSGFPPLSHSAHPLPLCSPSLPPSAVPSALIPLGVPVLGLERSEPLREEFDSGPAVGGAGCLMRAPIVSLRTFGAPTSPAPSEPIGASPYGLDVDVLRYRNHDAVLTSHQSAFPPTLRPCGGQYPARSARAWASAIAQVGWDCWRFRCLATSWRGFSS